MAEIRSPRAGESAGIARVESLAFNTEVPEAEVGLLGKMCAYEGDEVVATATVIDFDQWFGGSAMPCAGVASVAVLPEHRGRGVAGSLMRALLARERARGRLLSALYPANSGLYRSLGYEYCGLRPRLWAPLADLPPKPAGVEWPREMTPSDLPAVVACHAEWAAGHNGPLRPADPARWAQHVLAHRGEGVHQRTVVVPGERGVEGYASYFTTEAQGFGDYTLQCKHLVALTPAALGSLLAYFGRFTTAARQLSWFGPPSGGPAAFAMSTNGMSLGADLRRWMGRMLDVPGALVQRGYPRPPDGRPTELVLEVADPVFPENAGPWHVTVAEGRAQVVPAAQQPAGPGTGEPALPVGLLSAAFSGMATVQDLVALGALAPSGGLADALSRVFSGPLPWMPDFF